MISTIFRATVYRMSVLSRFSYSFESSRWLAAAAFGFSRFGLADGEAFGVMVMGASAGASAIALSREAEFGADLDAGKSGSRTEAGATGSPPAIADDGVVAAGAGVVCASAGAATVTAGEGGTTRRDEAGGGASPEVLAVTLLVCS